MRRATPTTRERLHALPPVDRLATAVARSELADRRADVDARTPGDEEAGLSVRAVRGTVG